MLVTRPANSYRIYDREIRSILTLPELPSAPEDGGKRTAISFDLAGDACRNQTTPTWVYEDRTPNGQVSVRVGWTEGRHWVQFPGLADFEVDCGTSRIVGYPNLGVSEVTIRHLLLDQVVPRLASHQGSPVLHGSCVRIGDEAVGFLGETGRGKSTLGSYFHTRGYDLLCDDSFLVQWDQGEAIAVPGYSGARLWKDSFEALGVHETSQPMAHYSSKKRVTLPRSSRASLPASLPLGTIFVLDDSAGKRDLSIQRLSGSRALAELLSCSFALDLSDPEAQARHFKNVGAIAAHPSVAIRTLSFPRKYADLPRVLDAVIDHVNAL